MAVRQQEQEGPGARARRQEKAAAKAKIQAVARRPVPSFTAMVFECGEGAFLEPWQLNVSRRGRQVARARRARSKSKKAGESSGKSKKKCPSVRVQQRLACVHGPIVWLHFPVRISCYWWPGHRNLLPDKVDTFVSHPSRKNETWHR